jgi:hypothetical protein
VIARNAQSGYSAFCYFVCEWDSRAKDKHYKVKDWPMRENSVLGEKYVRSQRLVDKDKIVLPPLNIILGFMKNFVKAMSSFEYSREIFPKLCDAKLKEGIFFESQILEIINDLFEHLLLENEKSAWLTFKAVGLNFFGNVTAENYKKSFEDL